MVTTITPNPLAAVPPSALAGRGGLVRFSVDDMLAMIRQGMVAEDASAELLDGYIVHTDRSTRGGDPVVHSPGHRKAVRRMTALVAQIDSPDRHVQIQSPIICAPNQMPEPDFAIIRGNDNDFTDRLPTAADVLCVVEVADSSLERDRDEKGPIYARAGVPQYIILNLRNRTAEVYVEPDRIAGSYSPVTVVDAGESIPLAIGGSETLSIGVSELLP